MMIYYIFYKTFRVVNFVLVKRINDDSILTYMDLNYKKEPFIWIRRFKSCQANVAETIDKIFPQHYK